MDTHFRMNFVGIDDPELGDTEFIQPANGATLQTIRGKSGGAYSNFGSFQWTKAVRGLSILVIKTLACSKDPAGSRCPVISGHTNSYASSLDYAIDKQPLWLIDMFGVDTKGTPLMKRVLNRTNPGRKHPGPVAIALNVHFLPLTSIQIAWNGTELKSLEEYEKLLKQIASDEDDRHSCRILVGSKAA